MLAALFFSTRAIPLEVLLIGSIMLLLITLLHGAGLDYIVERYRKSSARALAKAWRPRLAVFIFSGAILRMLFLHVAEIWLWGMVLQMSHLISTSRDAVYFAANTYTTLGYGDVMLPTQWRELSPIIAISGLFTFAWTTSEMFNIVGDQHELVAKLSEKKSSGANAS